MNLFQLQEQYMQILALSDHLDEETLKDTLESIQEPLEEKIQNYFLVVKNIEADVDLIDKEIKRMQDLKKSKQNTIKRLKETALDALELVGEETKTGGKRLRFDSPYIKTAYTQKTKSVNILDESKIIDTYKIPQPDKLDKKKIQDALKSGEVVEGAEMQETTGIRFK